MRNLDNGGAATIFGSLLLIVLVLTLASVLFLTLYDYNHSVQKAIAVEEERSQERIFLSNLATHNISASEYVYAIFINNTGSITARIRAVYINEVFLCDPSNLSLNPGDTYINPKDSLWIQLPPGVLYEPSAKMAVATERGMKSVEFEWRLKHGGAVPPPHNMNRFYLGPLMLDFNKFYYTECDPKNGSYDPTSWKAGWSVEIGTGSIAWNITVKNVDDRDITINQFSCLTLWPNDQPSERKAWYTEPGEDSFTQFIASNETVNIIYIWKTPKMKQMNPQSIYTTKCRNKVFLTFFGLFHEHEGTTKPYGQTIPFEAVLCERTGGTIEISAEPTIILANSSMNSLITAKVYNLYGYPVASANLTFSTDLGSISAEWVITDVNGTATVTLYPSTSPGLAIITATWEGLSKSTTVLFNAAPVAAFTESAETVFTSEVITFNASSSIDPDGNITSYSWDFGDGNNGTGVTVNHTYANDGTFNVVLTVVDNNGALDTAASTITVLNRLPFASFTENATTVLTGETISFNASGSSDPDGNITSYVWDFGDGADATGILVERFYVDDGIYNVTLTVTDDDGATAVASAIKIVQNRIPVASFNMTPLIVYTNETVSFDAGASYDLDGVIVSYFWDFGDGTNATGVLTSNVYVEAGTYNLALRVTDDDGAFDTVNATVTVEDR